MSVSVCWGRVGVYGLLELKKETNVLPFAVYMHTAFFLLCGHDNGCAVYRAFLLQIFVLVCAVC